MITPNDVMAHTTSSHITSSSFVNIIYKKHYICSRRQSPSKLYFSPNSIIITICKIHTILQWSLWGQVSVKGLQEHINGFPSLIPINQWTIHDKLKILIWEGFTKIKWICFVIRPIGSWDITFGVPIALRQAVRVGTEVQVNIFCKHPTVQDL